LELFKESLLITRKIGDPLTISNRQLLVGDILIAKADYAEALQYVAHRTLELLNDPETQYVPHNLSLIKDASGDRENEATLANL
jgi:hypothetical protein